MGDESVKSTAVVILISGKAQARTLAGIQTFARVAEF
jgi:hypothetical protein